MSLDSLLSKATVNDDNAPPGYVYIELGKIINADAAKAEECATALYKRLARSEAALVCRGGSCCKYRLVW
jgi:hypothetical protein